MTKKIYRVEVSVEMFVLAEDKREAETIAQDNAKFELINAFYRSSEAPHYLNETTYPWGGDGDRTVADYLAEQEAHRIADEKQLTLFGAK